MNSTPTTAPAGACAIYVRRSHVDRAGSERNGRSLAEQESECRALAERLGLEVVAVYSEKEGTGAFRRSRKPRPAWTTALADLDVIADAIAAVQDEGGTPSHILVSPGVAKHLAKLKTGTGSDQPLLGTDATKPTVRTAYGLPLVTVRALTDSAPRASCARPCSTPGQGRTG